MLACQSGASFEVGQPRGRNMTRDRTTMIHVLTWMLAAGGLLVLVSVLW